MNAKKKSFVMTSLHKQVCLLLCLVDCKNFIIIMAVHFGTGHDRSMNALAP